MKPDKFKTQTEKLGLDVGQTADTFGVTRQCVWLWTTGQRAIPKSVELLVKYFRKFGLPDKAFKDN